MARRNNEQWQSIIDEQAKSGLSAAEFCRQNGLNAKYFSLRKQKSQQEPILSTSGFIPLTKSKASSKNIELHLGDLSLSVPSGQPVAWVAELMRALK